VVVVVVVVVVVAAAEVVAIIMTFMDYVILLPVLAPNVECFDCFGADE
jgi:hypothetical protein